MDSALDLVRRATRIFAAGLLAVAICAAPPVFFPTGIDVPAVLGNQKLAQLGLVDVTAKPFQADPTGRRDSTGALQKAIEFARDKRLVAFFPLGTYLVSGTLSAAKTVDRMYPCLMVGELRSSGDKGGPARPLILLAPHSPGFDDPSHPKDVIYFWSHGYEKDAAKSKPGENMNQMLVGIDVTIGAGNSGAVGVSSNAAQGSGIQDSTIDATHGYSGIEGGAGSGGSHAGVTVIGGRFGLDLREERSNMVPTLAGITLIGQTEAAILTDSQTLVAVGVKIVSKAAGPLIIASFSNAASNAQAMLPAHGQMCLVDSEIVFETPSGKSATNVAISSWRSLYLNNVFVKNAAKIVANPDGSELTANPNGWMHVGEYAHGVRPPLFQGKYQYQAPVFLDGVRSIKDVIEGLEKGQRPPADLESRHVWGEGFPSWQSPGAVNVKSAPYNAKGDSQTDDTAALQRAIDEHEIVFLPKGLYRVTRTVRLKPNTKLVGVGQHLSLIIARGQTGDFSDVANPKPMILTADDSNAATAMSFCGVGTFEDAIGAYPVNWRAGRNSILRSVMFKMPNPEIPGRNSPYVVISGHGGGRWYNFYAEFFSRHGPEYRHLLVDGTSEPLRFYSCNPEHARSDANMEIRNSRYVTVYGLKGEGNYPVLLVRDSDHVRIFGYGGNAAAYEHTSLFLFERTPNFLVANAVAFPRLAGVGSDEFYAGRGVDPNLWYMIDDQPAGSVEVRTPPLDRPVLYRRGAPSGEPGR